MKSVLVPTEQNALLPSILQSALLLGRKFDSYIEGFALLPAMVEVYALDAGVPLPIEEIKDHDAEVAKEARSAFEKFMTGNGVPRASGDGALSFGWWMPLRTGTHLSAATAVSSTSLCWGDQAPAGGRDPA
jgi:hypothetical protein